MRGTQQPNSNTFGVTRSSLFSVAHTFFTFHTWFGLGGWRGVQQQPVALAAGAFLVPRDLHTGDVVTESLHEENFVLRRRGRSLGSLRHLRQFNSEKVSRVSLNFSCPSNIPRNFSPNPYWPLESPLSGTCSATSALFNSLLLTVFALRHFRAATFGTTSETTFRDTVPHNHTHTTMQLDFDDSTQFLPFLERFFAAALFSEPLFSLLPAGGDRILLLPLTTDFDR